MAHSCVFIFLSDGIAPKRRRARGKLPFFLPFVGRVKDWTNITVRYYVKILDIFLFYSFFTQRFAIQLQSS